MLTSILLVRESLFLVPSERDDSFSGREDVLAGIDKANKPATGPRHSRAALVGLGGVGWVSLHRLQCDSRLTHCQQGSA
jgi:hypothetical protein